MEIFQKETLKNWQDKLYSDPSQWFLSVHIKYSTRLKCLLRCAQIMQIYGLLKTNELKGKLMVLEPGCGIGAFSLILTIFGEVYSFDFSKEAIKIAKSFFGDNKSIKFFETDGTNPEEIPELAGKKFDFILMKEFYPLSKIIIDNTKPIDVVKGYYNMLTNGGIIIIEYAFDIKTLREANKELQVSKIIKEFQALVFNTLCLDLILLSSILFKNKRLRLLLLSLLNPIVVIICTIAKVRLSKTIIIRKWI